ncbi:hypothetical protein BVI061214_02157 [Thermus aquaticus]|uniref:Uncharacterized protein n=1 Tax=Thermus aquaticus TaxID=271 RepID=A0A0M9AGH7_THEAQ|nr:hypothetical protein BVI061214_02157 [Thermus aquaticus]
MEGRNVFILRLAPLEQDLTQEALEKDEIFVGWKKVKGLLAEGLSYSFVCYLIAPPRPS